LVAIPGDDVAATTSAASARRTWWLIALLLGLSVVVAATARVDCRGVLFDPGGGGVFDPSGGGVFDPGGRWCELVIRGLRVPWPPWPSAIEEQARARRAGDLR